MVFMIEAQVEYVLGALRALREGNLKYVDVMPEAQARYNEKLHARLERTVWATGCSSWYRTRSGKNTTLWPGFTFEYWLRMRRFDAKAYTFVKHRERSSERTRSLRGAASSARASTQYAEREEC